MASRFRRSALASMISASRASRRAFLEPREVGTAARSIKAERFESTRSMHFRRSSGSVMDVLIRTRRLYYQPTDAKPAGRPKPLTGNSSGRGREDAAKFRTAGGPILPHPFRDFLAFLGAHEFPAATFDAPDESGQSIGSSVQFLERSDYPLQCPLLGV